jgi:hypothetical protein
VRLSFRRENAKLSPSVEKMPSLLRNKPQTYIALDLRAHKHRILEQVGDLARVRLEWRARRSLEPGSLLDGSALHKPTIAQLGCGKLSLHGHGPSGWWERVERALLREDPP